MLEYLHKQVEDFPYFWSTKERKMWLYGFTSSCCCMLTNSKISIEEFHKLTGEIDKYLEQLNVQDYK